MIPDVPFLITRLLSIRDCLISSIVFSRYSISFFSGGFKASSLYFSLSVFSKSFASIFT